ncbi:HTH domain protein [Roseibium album]|nr:HTH domain protein [Roseibium album]
MRRTERLFQIIQILRANRSPVTGRSLAEELEISLRTLYRDMAELIAQRVPITGEAGTGYVLDDGYDMPPLMLTADELEAAALGAAWVVTQADPSLARSARDLVTKLSDAIPQELRPIVLDASSRSIFPQSKIQEQFDGAALRRAIRDRSRLQLAYKDQNDTLTTRVIWPLLIAYLDRVRFIVAWCETRQDYRHFRTDRVRALEVLEGKYPGRRAILVKGWETAMAERH